MNTPFQRLASASLFLCLLLAATSPLPAQEPAPEKAGEKSAIQKAIERARVAEAKATCLTLVQGVQAYYEDYSSLPNMKAREKPVPTDEPLINILLGFNADENPKNVRYVEFRTAKGKKRAEAKRGAFFTEPGKSAILRDPWGKPYYLILDEDYDESIVDPFGPEERPIHGRIVIAWSAGPDGKMDLAAPLALVNRDNILSWK